VTSFAVPDLADDAGALRPLEFRQRHGDGFLLVFSRSSQRTERRRVDTVMDSNATAALDVRIHVLLSEFEWIDCGRTPNNDVVIDDATVSKLHAWMRLEGGIYVLYDADSRNGTRVADRDAGKRGGGEGAKLRDNIGVELGSVRARFVSAMTLQGFICTVTQQEKPS
jgi:hypothetical protein